MFPLYNVYLQQNENNFFYFYFNTLFTCFYHYKIRALIIIMIIISFTRRRAYVSYYTSALRSSPCPFTRFRFILTRLQVRRRDRITVIIWAADCILLTRSFCEKEKKDRGVTLRSGAASSLSQTKAVNFKEQNIWLIAFSFFISVNQITWHVVGGFLNEFYLFLKKKNGKTICLQLYIYFSNALRFRLANEIPIKKPFYLIWPLVVYLPRLFTSIGARPS